MYIEERVTESTLKPSQLHEPAVRLRPPIAVELPDVPHLADLVEIEIGGDELRLVALRLDEELAARIA